MRTEILNADEIKKLLKYAKEYERPWYYIWSFAIYTGARNGELYALKWTDIDEGERIITIQRSYNKRFDEYKGTKTDEWRKVSINSSLWDLIQELKPIREHMTRGLSTYSEYVLPRPGWWQNGEQAKRLRMFCEEIGITPICFHTLRACFATELLKRGVPVPKVMRVGGWKSMKTMMHYIRLAGIDDKGITDPLNFESEEPSEVLEGRTLMEAVAERFEETKEESVASVIPLASRRHPRLVSR
ncbi:MAG: site-specific integrase [Proteobacteria bacterium]|nr:MAG: site-specific integrase [Pseudomonadota bacterium]